MLNAIKTENLLDLTQSIAGKMLSSYEYAYKILPNIKNVIEKLILTLDKDEFFERENGVFVAKSAKIYPSAYFDGPCIIGKNAEIRHCAFIRGSVLVGDDCVVGNSCELKNVILFNNSQVAHFNYVGDSIIGYKSHLGAGAITSNIKQDKKNIAIKHEKEIVVQTDLRKFGAIVGDNTEVGCNAVLSPGTVLGKNCRIYPLTLVRGIIKENNIYKNEGSNRLCHIMTETIDRIEEKSPEKVK